MKALIQYLQRQVAELVSMPRFCSYYEQLKLGMYLQEGTVYELSGINELLEQGKMDRLSVWLGRGCNLKSAEIVSLNSFLDRALT